MAWKPQHRLYARYEEPLGKSKPRQQVITPVGRELSGFVRAISAATERSQADAPSQALPHAA